MSNKELAIKETDLALMAASAGEEEHLSQEELELPFLRVAQVGTPQTKKNKPEYIEGLEAGNYFNTVSGVNYGDKLKVQVHGYFRNFIIWKGEKGSGEFNGTMTPEEFREFESKNTLTRDGGDMVQVVDGEEFRYSDTRNFIVTLPDHPDEGVLLYPMSSTGIKAAKTWGSLAMNRRLPGGQRPKRFATIWEIRTAAFEKNGHDWMQTAAPKVVDWASTDLLQLGVQLEPLVASIKDQGVKYAEANDSEDDESEF